MTMPKSHGKLHRLAGEAELQSRRAKKPAVSIAKLLEDEVLFFRTWATSPLKLGAFSPTSRALAELMVKHAAPDPAGYTIELGPGTGVVTQALIDAGISPERIVCIEYDKGFYRRLRERFPKVNVIRGDALDLDKTLGDFRDIRFSAALSGLPLLNLPKAKRAPYLEGILDRLVPGGIVSQLSYSLTPPQEAIPGRLAVDKSKWVTLNLPPGRAWIYKRPSG
jgi:phosphatidylethanolamine/phosphatidyl-N-methylethanolamine N-methyltransferase